MESRVQELRDKMTVSEGGRASLSRITAQLRIAENNLVTRQMLLQQAAQQRETARIEASRQVRYLSIGVAPIAPSEAAYPRRIENTLLAFVIFGGIYILLSLTVSILREQVSV
jgi:capsular polysaccharide transport system permease protein